MPLRLAPSILFCVLTLPWPALATSTLVVSRVQTAGESASDEFVELANLGAETADLAGYSLRKLKPSGDGCVSSALVSTAKFSGSIAPGGRFIIRHPNASVPGDLTWSSASYSLSDDTGVALVDADGLTLDAVAWGTGCGGEGVSAANPDDGETLVRRTESGNFVDTGDNRSDFETARAAAPAPGTETVRVSEIFPDPDAPQDAGEFIELHNYGAEDVDLSGWVLRDSSKTGKYALPDGTALAPNAFLFVADTDFKFSLNNEGDAVKLFNKNGGLVSETTYEDAPQARTWNYDPDKGRYRWSKTATPGEENHLGNAPTAKAKKTKTVQVVAGLPVEFKGSGKDADGESLKYVWDFGDGHKSYKKNTSHAFKKNGSYTVTLTVSDGTESDTSTVKVRVKKIKKDSVRIVSLVPNPAGSDTKNEVVSVTNRSDETIDLRGWIIATGKDKKHLVNHRINRNIVLKPGETEIVTRKDSAFTLNNKTQYLELRTPEGRTAQNISYARSDSATDDEIYVRTEGGWEWQKPLGAETLLAETSAQETVPPSPAPLTETEPQTSEGLAMSPREQPTIPQPAILGVSAEHLGQALRPDEHGLYHFTAPRAADLSIAKLLENLTSKLNAWLNRQRIFSFL